MGACRICKHSDLEDIREWFERGMLYSEIVKEFDLDRLYSKDDYRNTIRALQVHADAMSWVRPIKTRALYAEVIDEYRDEEDPKKRAQARRDALKAAEGEERVRDRESREEEGARWWDTWYTALGMNGGGGVEVIEEVTKEIEGEVTDEDRSRCKG